MLGSNIIIYEDMQLHVSINLYTLCEEEPEIFLQKKVSIQHGEKIGLKLWIY